MTASTSDTKPRFEEATAVSGELVRVTVTGVDVKGQMFRHPATVLMLDGCDCAFRSKSQPELDGSVLVEFDYPQADSKGRTSRIGSQGRVKSNQEEIDKGSYKVVVELEVAQTSKVLPKQVGPQTVIMKPALQPLTANRVGLAESKGVPTIGPHELPSPPKFNCNPQVLPRPTIENSATTKFESGELLSRSPAEHPLAVREAVKSAVASEIKQQIDTLKSWVSGELEESVPVIVSSNMERIIREAVVEQISANYQTSIQALNVDMARQIGDRMAESEDLRTALESMAKKLFEEQIELSRTAGAKVEQDLNTHAATIIQSFEESIAKMEARIDAACADMEGVLSKSQNLKQEAMDSMVSLQEASEHSKDADRARIETFHSQAASQLSTCATQFENQLNKISTERAGQFSMETEKHLDPHRQRAEETVEKLGAVLQLLQSTARVQQERLTEHSRTTAANFEKEI